MQVVGTKKKKKINMDDVNGVQYKKILVTGGAGFVGSLLVPMLLEQGYDVRVLDNLLFGQEREHHEANYPNFEFINGDVRDGDTVKHALEGIDLIVHLASLVGEPACRKDSGLCYSINRDAAEQLNRLRGSTPIIFPSSTSIYGETSGGVCNEDTAPRPALDYAKSKYEAEKIFLNGGNCIIFRPATAFGDSFRPRLDLLINEFVFRALKEKSIKVYNPDFVRTFVHVRDFAAAIIFMIERFDIYKNEVFNLGFDDLNLTKRQIAEAIHARIDFSLEFVENSTDPDLRNFVVDYSKFKKTGFLPAHSLSDGIDEMIKRFSTLHDSPSFYNVNFR